MKQLIDNRVFCVHGGLSPILRTIDQIQVIERLQEIPHQVYAFTFARIQIAILRFALANTVVSTRIRKTNCNYNSAYATAHIYIHIFTYILTISRLYSYTCKYSVCPKINICTRT